MKFEEKRNLLQQNLKAILSLLGWNGEWLGRKIGVSKQSISNYATGKIKMPKPVYISIMDIISEFGIGSLKNGSRFYYLDESAKKTILYTLLGYEDLNQPYWLYLDETDLGE